MDNVGPISIHALQRLAAVGVMVDKNHRFPQQLDEQDLARADLIIALDHFEHRPLMQARFPNWSNRIEYWDIPDLDRLSAQDACARLDQAVQNKITALGSF